ncbi:MAG: NAD(P)/FAD-dependent oxidoreductase [Vicinamibacterales bacterium]
MTPLPLPDAVDVLVVGARCAGAATARLLAAAGARVLVVDRAPAGTDTLSTHALMRGAVVQLARWGVLPAIVAAGTPAVRRTTFEYAGESVGVDITPKHGVDALYAPRRTVLDRVLAEAAAAAGADVRHGYRLRTLVRDDAGRVTGAALDDPQGQAHTVRAALVVGADGRHSTVARQVNAATIREGRAATATVYGHFPGITADGYRWLFAEGSSAGVIPTNDGASCVFATVPAPRFAEVFARDREAGFPQVLASLDPSLADATRAAAPLDGLHGFAGRTGGFTACQGPGWALVGDAAYFKDPLTAHGITDALLHAELLATAITAGTDAGLAWYEETRTIIGRPVFEITEAIAAFDWTLAEVRDLHTALARAMSGEIKETLAALGQAAVDFGVPALHDDQARRRQGLGGVLHHEQEPVPVG